MANFEEQEITGHDADAALRSLQMYLGQVEDGERTSDPSFVAGLAAVALATELRALGVRLDCVIREVSSR